MCFFSESTNVLYDIGQKAKISKEPSDFMNIVLRRLQLSAENNIKEVKPAAVDSSFFSRR